MGDGYTWGEVDPGKGEPLGGLAQTQTANVDNGSMFSYMLEFKFEVGVPEPPPPPPPSEEGTEEEQQ